MRFCCCSSYQRTRNCVFVYIAPRQKIALSLFVSCGKSFATRDTKGNTKTIPGTTDQLRTRRKRDTLTTRRQFMTIRIIFTVCLLTIFGLGSIQGADRPNLLMISCEDVSPWLGYNGESYATTPRIDALAKSGIAYTNAFATAPVCSPCRFAIITGYYATSYGTQRLRSNFAIPQTVGGFPAALRQAGYYCTNNEKTDYNTSAARRIIAEIGRAHV